MISDAAKPFYFGQSTNLVGLPMEIFGSCEFNDAPLPLHISGVREFNRELFAMLAEAETLAEASEAFILYMNALFGIDPEQRRQGKLRTFRSSYLDLLRGWGFDSNGAEGAVLKGWVESRFGLFPTFHKQPIRRISSAVWTTYVEEKMSSRFHNNSIYAQLDLLFEYCQWAIARFWRPNHTHVTLYRGVNALKDHFNFERRAPNCVQIRLNNIVSFSQDPEVASCFGDTILKVEAPLVKILFFNELLTDHALKSEGEILLIGGDYHAEIYKL